MRILITGANGFIGQRLISVAASCNLGIKAAVRELYQFPDDIEVASIGEINSNTNWLHALKDCDVVVHLAAMAHVRRNSRYDPLKEFRRVNVEGTLNLARQAVAAGVKRFIFISSIGVNGAETFKNPFSPLDVPSPHSPYAVSKYEAELGLQKLALQTGLEVVIIRAPLVYGPNAPGNFGTLVLWLLRGVPLPLGAIKHNRRSYVAVDNLIDLILTCVQHPKAINQIFLVSDGCDISTTDLLRKMGSVVSRSVLLIPVHSNFLLNIAIFMGKTHLAKSLLGSLQIDISKTRSTLDWNPPITMEEGLKRALKVID